MSTPISADVVDVNVSTQGFQGVTQDLSLYLSLFSVKSVTGFGTSSYVPIFAFNNSGINISSPPIVITGGFVGINNFVPTVMLDITGKIIASGLTVLGNIISTTNLNLISNNTNTGIIISGADVNLWGNISGSQPSTNTLTVPVSIPVFGATSKLCGEPDGFLPLYLSGRLVKIPYYY